MSHDVATQTVDEAPDTDVPVTTEPVVTTMICEDCKENLSMTFFHRYKNAKTGEYKRLKRCNACRQRNPKRPDLASKKSKAYVQKKD